MENCPKCNGEIDQTASACPHCGHDFAETEAEREVGTEFEAAQALLNIENQFRSGANWFFWIAGLSMINTILILSGSDWQFIIGLGVTQVIDGIAIEIGKQAKVETVMSFVAFGLDIVVAGFVVGIGALARKGFGWAFILGMILYAIDGLLFLLVQDWLSVGFHVFAMFGIWGGLKSLRQLQQFEAAVIQMANDTSREEDASSPDWIETDGAQS